jgi:Acetyltransferase (GNAT) domain
MINTETKDYTIARLHKNNLKDLVQLHSEVYAVPPQNDYFLKKYHTAYTGVENVGFIAYNKDNLPIAYYGVLPCFIQSGNEIILAAQSADTMTHPAYRYKGMFVELSNITFDLCRSIGINLIFGFPNQNSYHGAINKLGWKMTGAMDCFIIPVNSWPLQSISKKFRLQNLYGKYHKFILKDKLTSQQGIESSVLSDGFAGVCRNTDYINYKAYSPTKVLKIGDSKIWISTKYALVIGDMESVDESNFDAVISQLSTLAKKLGISQMQFHSNAGTSLHALFASRYKPSPSFPTLFQDFGSVIQPEKIKFTFADIDIF